MKKQKRLISRNFDESNSTISLIKKTFDIENSNLNEDKCKNISKVSEKNKVNYIIETKVIKMNNSTSER